MKHLNLKKDFINYDDLQRLVAMGKIKKIVKGNTTSYINVGIDASDND